MRETEAERKKRLKRMRVDGAPARQRLDRKAAGGSIRQKFDGAINRDPARPTVDEPGPMTAVAARARGGRMGWVDGQPAKSGGRLTASERQHLPKSDFALPGKGAGPKGAGSGSYPIPNASHARNALARVSQHGSPAQKAAVRAKVHAKFPNIGKGS